MAKKQWKAAPDDLYPYRGEYGGKFWAATFFLFTRALLIIIVYSLLAPPESPWSIFSHFPAATPSRPPPTEIITLPGVPDAILRLIENAFGMSSYNSLVFLTIVSSSIEFAFYNILWRREKFPMIGQGGALSVAIPVQMFDIIHVLLYIYTASRNPTWSPTFFRWMPMLIFSFAGLHAVADHSKYLFRQSPRNDGKIYMGSAFSIVRHPNFLGFFVWRVAFAIECGGLLLGTAMAAMFANLFMKTSIPGLEGYLAEKYGRQWNLYEEKVKWRIFPGIY